MIFGASVDQGRAVAQSGCRDDMPIGIRDTGTGQAAPALGRPSGRAETRSDDPVRAALEERTHARVHSESRLARARTPAGDGLRAKLERSSIGDRRRLPVIEIPPRRDHCSRWTALRAPKKTCSGVTVAGVAERRWHRPAGRPWRLGDRLPSTTLDARSPRGRPAGMQRACQVPPNRLSALGRALLRNLGVSLAVSAMHHDDSPSGGDKTTRFPANRPQSHGHQRTGGR